MTTLDINDTDPRRQYTAGAGQTVFAYPFEIFADSDLAVYVDGVLQVLNTDYTVSGAGVENGGSITFASPLTGGEIVTILRDLPYARDSLYTTSGPFKASSVERDFDTLVAMIQQIDRDLGFAIRASTFADANEASDFLLPSVASRAGKILAFDSNGKAVVSQVGSTYASYPSVADYTALRGLAAPSDGDAVVVSGAGVAGLFVFDSSELTADNGGTIIDPTDGTTGAWVRRHSSPTNVSWFGASTSNTPAQNRAAIQAAVDSGELDILFTEMYEVDKATALFSSDFPNADQPCIFLKNKAGMRLRSVAGGGMTVSTHAQGIIEMQGCTDCNLEGLVLTGPGDFPNLDGTTGSGEKGTPTAGYNTTNAGIWGLYKNNRLDTSANTSGGFGGAFPQYAGGTAGTWGTWNGGYIGNVAYGLLIQNGCERITVRGCKASGFNYVGLAVGHSGDSTLTENKDIRFLDCIGVSNQSAGIHTLRVDGVVVDGCILSDNGHPDWTFTDTISQAGYGYTARGIATYYTKNAVVTNCLVEGNDRKGLDAHAVVGLQLVNNVIRNCGTNGISVPWTSATQPCRSIVIRGNVIQNCAYATNHLGAILGGGAIDGGYSYANSICDLVIDGNLIIDCGSNGIEIKNGRNIQITNNIVRGFDDRATHGPAYGMFLGRLSTAEPIYNLNCSGNVIDADGDTDRYRGITVRRAVNSQVNHNMIYLDHASASLGLELEACTTTQAFGNVAYTDPAAASAVPLNLLDSDGMAIGNYSDPDAGALSYPLANETTSGEREKAFRVPHVIQLDITFNGTTSPSYVVNAGEDYIASVQELATYGVGITFKNMHSTVLLRSFMTEKSAGGLSTGGGFAGFIYERGLSHTGMEIGLKVSQTGANIIASAVTSGTLSVTLLAF